MNTKGIDVDNSEQQDLSMGYVLDDQVGFVLRLASQRHAAIFQTHAPNGLTPTQFSVLIRVEELGQCSQNRLGRLVSIDVATIKGVVDRLKNKGLLQLEPDAKDKRRTTISLTAKAAAMMENLRSVGTQITRETLRPLDPEEQATLLNLLRKIT